MVETHITQWIREYIIKLHNDQLEKFAKDYPTSSTPVSLFEYSDMYEEHVFNPSNWNSGQDIVRHFLLELYDKGVSNQFDINMNEYRLYGFIQYDEDDWYGNIIHDCKGFMTTYFIKWYKSRGRTEMILKNGEPIILDEYVWLVNLLHQAGLITFEFDKDNTEEYDIPCILGIDNIKFNVLTREELKNEINKSRIIEKIQKNSLYGTMGSTHLTMK